MMYDHPRSHPISVLSDSEFNSIDLPMVESGSSALEYGQCALRGYLYKKERFMTWTKLYGVIRNNFLECHKSQGDSYSPILKLFLPGSELKEGGGDTKKKWAFQVSSFLCTLS